MLQKAQEKIGLNSFALKLFGIALMVIDHIYEMFWMFGVPLWFTMLGRIVAPIFLFLTVEGFTHTSSRKKYLLRLLAGFWVMGVASFILQRVFPLEDVVLINNIFGTFFVAVLYMCMLELIQEGWRARKPLKIALGIVGILAPVGFNLLTLALAQVSYVAFIACMIALPGPLLIEGGFAWVLLGVAFYLLRKWRWAQILALGVMALLFFIEGSFQWLMVFAGAPILLYNGKPGKKSKWLFYIFYPAHIYILYVISYFMH